uniref:Uncharacterized protein n=1 Tax=Nothobranchius kadleci TaxID=1051664 RepID=A0A1A8DX49_NOTKA
MIIFQQAVHNKVIKILQKFSHTSEDDISLPRVVEEMGQLQTGRYHRRSELPINNNQTSSSAWCSWNHKTVTAHWNKFYQCTGVTRRNPALTDAHKTQFMVD